jgi:hypothetical protein
MRSRPIRAVGNGLGVRGPRKHDDPDRHAFAAQHGSEELVSQELAAKAWHPSRPCEK